MAELFALLPKPKHVSKSRVGIPPPPPPPVHSRGREAAFLASQGRRSSETVHSSIVAVRPRQVAKQYLEKPSKEVIAETTDRTKSALEKRLSGKIGSYQTTKNSAVVPAASTYVRYNGNSGNNGQAKQRVVRLVREQVDPLEPAKFRHKKVMAGPPSPPAPVLHAPAKKLTKADEAAWKIPPCVSNWKNRQGFTIDLDKRLAADGSDLLDKSVNDRFSDFSEALFVAEQKAREEVQARQAMQKRILDKSREEEEERLKALAARARLQRSGGIGGRGGGELSEDKRAFEEREAIRRERKRERERDIRMVSAGLNTKSSRDQDRDVSEKVALGMLSANGASETAQFDERLFNQSSGGLSSGFGAEDEYNMYTNRLFAKKDGSVYRPKGVAGGNASGPSVDDQLEELRSNKRFKGFSGSDNALAVGRDGAPVQFERSSASALDPQP